MEGKEGGRALVLEVGRPRPPSDAEAASKCLSRAPGQRLAGAAEGCHHPSSGLELAAAQDMLVRRLSGQGETGRQQAVPAGMAAGGWMMVRVRVGVRRLDCAIARGRYWNWRWSVTPQFAE